LNVILNILEWLQSSWSEDPLRLLNLFVPAILTAIFIVIYDYVRARKVSIEIVPEKIKNGGVENISGITITAISNGITNVRIKNIGVLVPGKERLLQGNANWVLTEKKPCSKSFPVDANDPTQLSDIYDYIQSGKYVAFAEADNGKRYYSCNCWIKRCRKLKL